MHRITPAVLFLATFAAGTATAATRPVALAPFTKIEARGSDTLIVTQGPRQSIAITGAPEDLDRMALTVTNDTLSIERRSGRGESRGVTVTITLPELRHLGLRGSGTARIEGLRQPRLALDAAGSSAVTVRDVVLHDLAVSMDGSGSIDATGRVAQAAVSLSGSGSANLRHLDIVDAALSVKGSGSIDAHVTGSAAIDDRGSGNVDVSGTDRCTVDRRGSGRVRCGR